MRTNDERIISKEDNITQCTRSPGNIKGWAENEYKKIQTNNCSLCHSMTIFQKRHEAFTAHKRKTSKLHQTTNYKLQQHGRFLFKIKLQFHTCCHKKIQQQKISKAKQILQCLTDKLKVYSISKCKISGCSIQQT